MDCRLFTINILYNVFHFYFYSQLLVTHKVELWLKISPICETKTKAHGDEVYKFRCSIFHFQRRPTTHSRSNLYFLWELASIRIEENVRSKPSGRSSTIRLMRSHSFQHISNRVLRLRGVEGGVGWKNSRAPWPVVKARTETPVLSFHLLK